jgi:hypothetical protein
MDLTVPSTPAHWHAVHGSMAFCSSSIETCVGYWFPQFCPDMQFPQASENTPASAQQAASGNAHVPPLHHEVAAAVPRAPGEAHAQQTGAQSSGSVQAVPGAPFFHDQLGGIDPTHVPVRPLAVAVHSYTCAPLIGVDVQAITPASSNDTTLLVVVVVEPSVVGVVGPVVVELPQAVATTMKAMYFHELTRPRLDHVRERCFQRLLVSWNSPGGYVARRVSCRG